MKLDIQAPKNSILWRPDNVAGQFTEGKLVLDLYASNKIKTQILSCPILLDLRQLQFL